MGLSKEALELYLRHQIEAFNKWVWDFGIATGMNLREHFTEDEIWHIWIVRYAAEFHDEYFKKE